MQLNSLIPGRSLLYFGTDSSYHSHICTETDLNSFNTDAPAGGLLHHCVPDQLELTDEILDQWTTALNSGKYTPYTSVLRRNPGSRQQCCLGVMVDLLNLWAFHPKGRSVLSFHLTREGRKVAIQPLTAYNDRYRQYPVELIKRIKGLKTRKDHVEWAAIMTRRSVT